MLGTKISSTGASVVDASSKSSDEMGTKELEYSLKYYRELALLRIRSSRSQYTSDNRKHN